MVVQRTINSLKERPRDERKVIAATLALIVVAILLIGWAFLFVKRIQRDVPIPTANTEANQLQESTTTPVR